MLRIVNVKILVNIDFLKIYFKISENNTAIFKLKRFDDIFLTIQYFCEINNLDEFVGYLSEFSTELYEEDVVQLKE